MAELIPPEKLRELVTYNPGTGKLTWLHRSRSLYKNDRIWRSQNSKFEGKAAFATPDKNGYFCGCTHGRNYKAHRVAWALMTGQWPDGDIDHIDRNPANNAFENLRIVPRIVNARNMSLARNNTSGHCGVNWSKQAKKWWAQIVVEQKLIHLGFFKEIDEAVKARKAAEVKYGFCAGHGSRRASAHTRILAA